MNTYKNQRLTYYTGRPMDIYAQYNLVLCRAQIKLLFQVKFFILVQTLIYLRYM